MDFNHMQTWHYFALIGGGVLVLGIILYFLPAGKMKIPAIVTVAFGGLAAGLAIGIIFMAGFGYQPFAPDRQPASTMRRPARPRAQADRRPKAKTPGRVRKANAASAVRHHPRSSSPAWWPPWIASSTSPSA